MKLKIFVLSFIFFLTALTTLAAEKESTYDRVMRTGTIRCGYAVFSPMIFKDPNTGHLSGLSYDFMNKIGKVLSLKIDWVAEAGFDEMLPGVGTRYDALCSAILINGGRARVIDWTQPIVYQSITVWARADDHRFDKDLSKIDDPSIKVSTVDGLILATIAGTDFPKAQVVSVPQISDITTPFMYVMTGKADVTFLSEHTGTDFLKKNPGTIRNVSPQQPIRVYPFAFAVPKNNDAFKSMINAAIGELLNSGEVARLMKKYNIEKSHLLEVATPYKQ